jgi:AraC-like DNA-binding protein
MIATEVFILIPSDGGLRRIADGMTADPSDRATVHEWAKRIGVSERTLSRLVLQETGMSFGRWRQQLGIMLAVKWLAGGASIQEVANDLGYESIPSFVTMFRKAIGVSPGRYMAERHSRR